MLDMDWVLQPQETDTIIMLLKTGLQKELPQVSELINYENWGLEFIQRA